MSVIAFDSGALEAERRRLLHEGRIFVFSPRLETLRLRERMLALVESEFPAAYTPPSRMTAAFRIGAAELRKLVARDPVADAALRDVLASFGCDADRTYRHPLFLRTVPPVPTSDPPRPAFHAAPHRDLWLAAHPSQINWWMPVSQVDENTCLVLYPGFWQRAVANDSSAFDYLRYKARFEESLQRREPGANVAQAVEHPQVSEPVPASEELRVICPPGGLILFSAAHLHGSARNYSDGVRLSVDFRTCNLDDVERNVGPQPIDTFSNGSNLGDFVRVSDNVALRPVQRPGSSDK